MITNLWNNVSFYCWAHEDVRAEVMSLLDEQAAADTTQERADVRRRLDAVLERVRLEIRYGKAPFYACPRYMRQDEAHPFGHLLDESACTNAIWVQDAEKIVQHLSDVKEQMLLSGEMADFTNYHFQIRSLDAIVIQERPHHIWLGICNRAALARGRGV